MSLSLPQLRRRLECTYAISRSLAAFNGVEAAMPDLLRIVNRTLPLSSATLIEGRRGQLRMIVWHAELARPDDLLRAETNARAAFGYLTGPVPAVSAIMDVIRLPLALARRTADLPTRAGGMPTRNFITLPLAIERGAIFGALQVEGAYALDEDDLAFIDSLAHELAVTIDRHYASRRVVAGTGTWAETPPPARRAVHVPTAGSASRRRPRRAPAA